MRHLLFLNKVAFVCNILFIVSLIARRVENVFTNQDINNYIIILGWIVSPILNMALNIAALYFFFQKKETELPKWLLLVNLLFFLSQIFYFFIFN